MATNLINCIVLEDDELAAKSLIRLIGMLDQLNFMGHYANPIQAKNEVDIKEIDLIFLDVEMPEVTGLEFIKTLKNPPKVIVTTSRSDFAMGAFEIEAVDFLLKPVTLTGVMSALGKYNKLQPHEAAESDSIFVKVDSKLVNIKLSDLEWVEALGDYAGFQVNEKRYVVKSTLTAIEERITHPDFVRVHRSFIVNISKIRDIDDSSLVINGKLIPISRGDRPELLKRLNLLK